MASTVVEPVALDTGDVESIQRFRRDDQSCAVVDSFEDANELGGELTISVQHEPNVAHGAFVIWPECVVSSGPTNLDRVLAHLAVVGSR